MQGSGRRRLAGIMAGLALIILGGCAHNGSETGVPGDPDVNIVPTNYKNDILAAMHAYLSDPTGIRDAGIAEPALKSLGGSKRFVVCVRYNAKKGRNEYIGVKEVAAVFVAGRFDRFVETAHDTANDECAGATYAAFPELEKLSR